MKFPMKYMQSLKIKNKNKGALGWEESGSYPIQTYGKEWLIPKS